MCFLAGYPTSSMFKFKKIFCFEKSDMCSIDVIQKKEAEKLFSHMFPSVWQLDHSALKLFGIWCKDTNKHMAHLESLQRTLQPKETPTHTRCLSYFLQEFWLKLCSHRSVYCNKAKQPNKKDTTSSLRSTLLKAKPNCLRCDQWQHMLLNAAITEFKLHAFSLVQTTIGFCKLCCTGSPVYHVVLNQVFSRFFGENLGCPYQVCL